MWIVDLTPTLMETMIIPFAQTATTTGSVTLCMVTSVQIIKILQILQIITNICWHETKYFTLQTTLIACKRKRRMVLMDGEEDAEVSRIQPRWPLECYFTFEKLLFQSCRIGTRWGWRWRRRGVRRHPGRPERRPERTLEKPKVSTIWTSETNPQVHGLLDDHCEYFLYDHLHADFPDRYHVKRCSYSSNIVFTFVLATLACTPSGFTLASSGCGR